MTVTEGIHALAEWLEGEVCPHIKLKVPSNERQTAAYDYQLANPSVHKMYAPPAKLAQQVNREICPGILVHLVNGRDKPRESARDLRFRLLLRPTPTDGTTCGTSWTCCCSASATRST